MDREIYEVARDRFHLYEKNTYILQGTWPKDAIMCARLDGQDLPASIEKLEMVSAMERFQDPDRVRGERITAKILLPPSLAGYRKLKVYALCPDGRRLLWYRVTAKSLAGKKDKPQFYLEEEKVEEGILRLRGWAIASAPVQIRLSDRKEQDIPVAVQRMARADVDAIFEEAGSPEKTGFYLEASGLKGREVILSFFDGTETAQTAIPLKKMGILQKKGLKYLGKGMRVLRAHGPAALVQKTLSRLQEESTRALPYPQWIRRHLPDKKELARQRRDHLPMNPLLSILVPLYCTPPAYLESMVESVKAQTYGNWELVLSDGSPSPSPLAAVLEEYASDPRIRVLESPSPLRIAENTNAALHAAKGDYLAFLDHDDALTPDALYACVQALISHPDARILYSDEDKMTMDGHQYFQPHFKPDYNEHLLCTVNYFCHLLVLKSTLAREVGLFDPALEGAQDYDYILRAAEKVSPDQIVHIPRILYHWRAHEESTAQAPESKAYAFQNGVKALEGHYARLGRKAHVSQGEFPGLYKTRFLWDQTPLVSIIIPNKDHIDDLKRCMEAIDAHSTYRNFEYVIVENNSDQEETFAFYRDLEKRDDVTLVRFPGSFNFSAINNFGARYAKGEYFLLLNNDTQIISPDFLEEMLSFCQEEEVGAVGARLYYEDDTIQHAGVVIGFGGIAGHCFVMQPRGTTGYMHRIICTQEYSAVTAACMLVKAKAFWQVGGMSEELAVAFNDIDFCLKLRREGYKIVYAPYAELYHFESKSRGLEDTPDKVARFNREMAIFEKRWPKILRDGDPYYNPNLTLKSQDFSTRRI